MITGDGQTFFILQKNKINRFLKIFRKKEWVKILIFTGFLLVALILAAATYFFSKSTFFFLGAYPEFQEGMSFYILATWFFLILILTFGSGLVSSMRVFFVQDDDSLLLSSPIKTWIIFKSRLVDLLVLSSWPILVFALPLLLAFHHSFSLSILNFLLSVLAVILILLTTTLLSSILALKITSFTGRIGRKVMNFLGLVALPLLAWWATRVLIPAQLMGAFDELKLAQINQFLKSLPVSANFLPSTWVVNFIFYWREDFSFALLNLGKLLALLLILLGFVYWLVKREYFYTLDRAQTGRFIAGPHDVTQTISSPKPFPYFLKGIKGAFVEKDILMFSRDQTEILQVGFILFLVLFYFLLLSRFPLERLGQALPNFSLENLIKLNFFFTAHILIILALRFIFPTISIEGQSSWLVWPAPFSKSKLFWQKFLIGWGFLGLVAGIMSFVSALILKLGFNFFILKLPIFLIISLTLTAINLSSGTIFPNFTEKNPEKISTSSGGIFATALSLFYVFMVSLIEFSTSKLFSLTTFLSFCLLSASLMIVFLLLALSKIDKYQF